MAQQKTKALLLLLGDVGGGVGERPEQVQEEHHRGQVVGQVEVWDILYKVKNKCVWSCFR